VIAWTIMFVRVVVMTGLISRPLAGSLAIALGMMALAGTAVLLVLFAQPIAADWNRDDGRQSVRARRGDQVRTAVRRR
jgi:hypothetical protein